MYTLILDTAERNLGVLLAKNDKIVDYISYPAFRKQSELLVEELDRLMKKNEIEYNEIESIYINNGPGSYTGVRMSLAVAKTLSFIYPINVFLVSSLLAQTGLTKLRTLSLIDARAGRYYFAVYEKGVLKGEEKVISAEDLKKFLIKNRSIRVVSNSSLDGCEIIEPLHGVLGIFEVLSLCDKVDDSLRVEPFYFKEAVS